LIVTDSGVYRIGHDEFLETHVIWSSHPLRSTERSKPPDFNRSGGFVFKLII
jgi:hypothetical protein